MTTRPIPKRQAKGQTHHGFGVMIYPGATGMSAKSRATQHRQWAVNAIAAAMQSASSIDQEVLFMIARKHLTRAQKADHTRNPEPDGLPGRAKSRPTGQ
jgi:hypothetical protein